jgi:hypothetical protein
MLQQFISGDINLQQNNSGVAEPLSVQVLQESDTVSLLNTFTALYIRKKKQILRIL